MMNLTDRARIAWRLLTRGETTPSIAAVVPPPRDTNSDPLTLSTVFRGVQVLQTALSSLPIYEAKGGLRLDSVSAIIEQPDVNRSRRDWIADIVASLAIDGNAFIRLRRFGGTIVSCEVLPPSYVTVSNRTNDPAAPDLEYTYLGQTYTPADMVHLKFLNVAGKLRGYGPISAAREEITSAQMAKAYKTKFYSDSSNLKGYLSTESKITKDVADQAKAAWTSTGDAADIKVLGSSLKYVPLDLKPADLQFLESQKFDTTQIARLLGIPASIMLAAVDGSNLTYSNIEQSWIEFADYTLSAYAGEIEEVFNRLLPRGRTAHFDWDSSRRTDLTDRYNAWSTALSAGFMTIDEIRAREGYAPLAKKGTDNDA